MHDPPSSPFVPRLNPRNNALKIDKSNIHSKSAHEQSNTQAHPISTEWCAVLSNMNESLFYFMAKSH